MTYGHGELVYFLVKPSNGYLTKEAIEAMRSELAHDIFRQDFAHIYGEQNQARAGLKRGAADLMDELLRQIASGVCENKVIEEKIQRLAGRLQNTGGKKVYGYLKADVKALVDQIVDELAKDARVAELYAAWGRWQDEILKTYTDKLQPLPPLSRQPQFKSIKNTNHRTAKKKQGGIAFRLCRPANMSLLPCGCAPKCRPPSILFSGKTAVLHVS